MTPSDAQWASLFEMLHEAGLGHLLLRRSERIRAQLEEFLREYNQKLVGIPSGVLTALTLADLVEEYGRNPHRVEPLLQALAFSCTPNMLAMMWMVLMGATVETMAYTYEREKTSRLVIVVLLPDEMTRLAFESDEHWDLAILRLAGVSKTDDRPIIESFYALHVPPSEGYARLGMDRWTLRVLEWVQDYAGGFFCPSLIDARNIDEIAKATVDAVQKGWLKASAPTMLEAVSKGPTAAPSAIALLSSDAAMSVTLTANGKRALRRTRFYRRLAHASAHSLEMVRSEIKRVLAGPSPDYEPDDVAELEDQLRAIDALLHEAA